MRLILFVFGFALSACGDPLVDRELGLVETTAADMESRRAQMASQDESLNLMRLADQGNAEAQLMLSDLYYHGRSVPKDYKKAFEWALKAAEQGLPDAQLKIGLMHDLGIGTPEDDTKVFDWFLKAAEQGLPKAQSQLAYLYYSGKGASKEALSR